MMRLWLVTGMMTEPGVDTIVGSLFEAETEEEALGKLLAREQAIHPHASAHAFRATDATETVRSFVERHPQ